MKKIELYDQYNIDQMIWPNNDNGQYARKYLLPLVYHGVQAYIANVRTTLMIIKVDEIVLPLTINDAEYDNSYVCSPYNHYILYALEELRELKKPLLESFLAKVIKLLGCFLRWTKVNKVVHVNNWLLSTNLYPRLSSDHIIRLIKFLQQKFPEHTIVFRSLNHASNHAVLDTLSHAGCFPLASRQVYGMNLHDGKLPVSYDVKRDLKLLLHTPYEIVTGDNLNIEDAGRIVELYNMLYIDKYSAYNPLFTEEFVKLLLKEKTFTFFAFRKENRIDAVLGFFRRDGVMTTPLIGYDTSLPISLGLYRLLSIKIMQAAAGEGIYLNNSSGAAQFKRNRGSVGQIEYSMVYDKHLPQWRRSPWLLLKLISNKIGVLLMMKYKL